MSLVGNLEDLSLGDILQILSLSQKSGVLALKSGQGAGRIVFRAGMVHAASLQGVPGQGCSDLRELLVGRRRLDPARFDACVSDAVDLGVSLEERLEREAGLHADAIEACLRESVELSVLEMFTWLCGEFSFDVRPTLEPDDPQLALQSGVNAQYLAMEGMRVRDEGSRLRESTETAEPSARPEESEDEQVIELTDLMADEDLEGPGSAVDAVVSAVLEADFPPAAAAASVPRRSRGPMVLIDPDVAVAEWVKNAVHVEFTHVHVFQQAEQGLARIRQYLIRGELPVVLISSRAEIDRLSGIQGLADFVKRLKAQASRLPVLGLLDEDDEEDPPAGLQAHLDGLLTRPARRRLRELAVRDDASPARALAASLMRLLSDRSSGT